MGTELLPENIIPDYIPYKLIRNNDSFSFSWLFIGKKKMAEPFFSETAMHAMSFPENRKGLQVCSAETFLLLSRKSVPLNPAVCIFHVSRCGSTLLAQLLAEDPSNVVLSEVPLFDQLLAETAGKNKSAGELFEACVKLTGQKRNDREQRACIKTDSWHIFYYDILRRMYPGTLFVFLYRNPVEVLRSHLEHRGMQMVPGLLPPSLFGITPSEKFISSPEKYIALVLEQYFEKFLAVTPNDPNCIVANYSEGILPVVLKIYRRLGIAPGETLLARMKERAGFHSKNPQQSFTNEPVVESIPSCLDKVLSLYTKLETQEMVQRS